MLLYLLFMIPPLIFMIYAQIKVKSTYSKYAKVGNHQGITGAEAAAMMLRANGINDVPIETVKGKLTDHYDPAKKVLRLSPEVRNTTSVAAIGIALHEVGHAVQHHTKYGLMRLRSALVPAANIGSNLGWIFIFLGLILMAFGEIFADFGMMIAMAGLILFSLAVLFVLVTLPVEYNASNRARKMMRETGLLVGQEYEGASAVLSAAALTYVAALLQAVAQLLYFGLMIFGGRRS